MNDGNSTRNKWFAAAVIATGAGELQKITVDRLGQKVFTLKLHEEEDLNTLYSEFGNAMLEVDAYVYWQTILVLENEQPTERKKK